MRVSPFQNDPFSILDEAFHNLFPDKPYEAWLADESEDEGYGSTLFPEDGGIPIISISGKTPLQHAPEIFAHELAHVAAGVYEEHGPVWETVFHALYEEYMRIIEAEEKLAAGTACMGAGAEAGEPTTKTA